MPLVLAASLVPGTLEAQDAEKPSEGLAPPSSERLRIKVRLMAGYGSDDTQSSVLGFESQGRVGYAIIELFGKIDDEFRTASRSTR